MRGWGAGVGSAGSLCAREMGFSSFLLEYATVIFCCGFAALGGLYLLIGRARTEQTLVRPTPHMHLRFALGLLFSACFAAAGLLGVSSSPLEAHCGEGLCSFVRYMLVGVGFVMFAFHCVMIKSRL